MLPNCSGLKEGEVKISAASCNFHKDVWVKQRKTVLFTSNTEVENKFQKVNQCGESVSRLRQPGAVRAQPCLFQVML